MVRYESANLVEDALLPPGNLSDVSVLLLHLSKGSRAPYLVLKKKMEKRSKTRKRTKERDEMAREGEREERKLRRGDVVDREEQARRRNLLLCSVLRCFSLH